MVSTLRQLKRLIIFIAGFTILLIGVALLVLPGPGIVTIVLGLAILGTEFVWARRIYMRLKDGSNNIRDLVFTKSKKG
ncbi:MAG: hypothetical protein Fur0020_03700 [Thermodesulfovibrionia bacterium]